MSFPAFDTDPGAPPPGTGILAVAGLAAWLTPVPLGLTVLYGLAPASAALSPGGPADSFAFLGLLMVYSPILSWVGVVPGVLAWRLLARKGLGGWAATLGAGIALALLIGAAGLSAPGPLLGFALVQSAVFWLTLRVMHPAAFRRVG